SGRSRRRPGSYAASRRSCRRRRTTTPRDARSASATGGCAPWPATSSSTTRWTTPAGSPFARPRRSSATTATARSCARWRADRAGLCSAGATGRVRHVQALGLEGIERHLAVADAAGLATAVATDPSAVHEPVDGLVPLLYL